jgi:hypothetical protein
MFIKFTQYSAQYIKETQGINKYEYKLAKKKLKNKKKK